jgi:uncharacterized protein
MAATSMAQGNTTGRRRGPQLLAFAYLLVFIALAMVFGAVAMYGRASDGDPVVVLDVSAQSPSASGQHALSGPGSKTVANQSPSAISAPALPTTQNTTATVKLPPQIVPSTITKPIIAGRSLIADPALIEQSQQGPLPRIADDGRSPMTAYAPPAPSDKRPRIAIVITGLGISAKETSAAIAQLPPEVTLAFAPYDDDVQRWVSEARKQGHEVLMEVPMEPYDFPDSDPGPHTLRAGVGEESNTERLTWSLTRFTGYAGVTNLLGSRFLSDPDSLEPVLTFLERRGLFFFESGPTSRSTASDVAQRLDAPYLQSSTTIDTIQTAMEIDQRLSELETRARANGNASGAGFLYPVTIERVTEWAHSLAGRGFVLVPASAIVPHAK